MKSSQIVQPGQIQLIESPSPEPSEGELLVRVMASGICGTDLHIFRGEYLGSYPVIPGHELSGVVEAVGEEITRFRPGDRVAVEPNIGCDNCDMCLRNLQNFCLNWQAIGVTRPGGMAECVLVPEKAVFSIGELPFEVGAFVEPLSCVIHGVERAQPRMGDRVAVFGAGPIGILMLQVIQQEGTVHVTMLENNPGRAEFALQMGADAVMENLADLPRDHFDMVVDATGSLPLMAQTIDYVRPSGTVLLFGVPPSGKTMELEAFKIFRKGLTVLSSFTSRRNSFQAVSLLQSEKVQVAPLISHRLTLEEFPKGLALLEQRPADVKKVMILPNS